MAKKGMWEPRVFNGRSFKMVSWAEKKKTLEMDVEQNKGEWYHRIVKSPSGKGYALYGREKSANMKVKRRASKAYHGKTVNKRFKNIRAKTTMKRMHKR